MYVIPIYNNKGGAGKTTAAITISGILADIHKKRVLLIDTDSQINTTKSLLGANETYREMLRTHEPSEVRDLRYAIEHRSLDECIYHVFFPKKNKATGRKIGEYYIDVVPGNYYLDNIPNQSADVLREIIEPYRDNYDFCILDLHPSQAGITMAAYLAADYIMIPSQLQEFHIEGVVKAFKLLDGIKKSGECQNTEILGIFFTQCQNTALQHYIEEEYGSRFGDKLFKTKTRSASILNEATFEGVPINSYKPSHKITKEYRALVEEMLKRIKKLEKEKESMK